MLQDFNIAMNPSKLSVVQNQLLNLDLMEVLLFQPTYYSWVVVLIVMLVETQKLYLLKHQNKCQINLN